MVVAFSVLLGLFLARVAAPYQRADNLPQWNQAQWITSAGASAVAYYRRDFVISSLPEHAYIMLAATDTAELYINGKSRQQLARVSTAVYDIIDISQHLVPGKNIIAIRVERKTLDGPPGVIAKLLWQDAAGLWLELDTDVTWRVAQRAERQNDGAIVWYETRFDDLHWAHADVLESNRDMLLYAEHPWANPQLFRTLPRGSWMWEGAAGMAGVSFSREFDLGDLSRGGIKNAWLGVASTVPYVLVINGARGPTIMPSNQFMDTYDIGNFLFSGRNTIAIDISAEVAGGRLAIAAIVQTENDTKDLSSSEQWLALSSGQEPREVASMGVLSSYPYIDRDTGQVYRLPVLRLTDLHIPGGLLLRHIIMAWPWIAGVFALSLLIINIGFAQGPMSVAVAKAGMLPWIVADLVLLIVFLLPLDVRITEADIFNLPMALTLSIFPPLLFVSTLIEIARDRKQNW